MLNKPHLVAAFLLLTSFGFGQIGAEIFVPWSHPYETGSLTNTTFEPLILDTHEIVVPGASSIRLLLTDAQLGPKDAILVRSLWDAQTQRLTAAELVQWQNSSAYFNGDTLYLSLLVQPGSTASYEIATVLVEAGPIPSGDSICGPTDDRVLSQDWRSMRALGSSFCTVWAAGPECLLSAGHCSGTLSVAQAEVPLSTATGSLVQPPVDRQWPILAGGVTNNGGVGNDYAVRLVGTNSQGVRPADLYGYFTLATTVPAAGAAIRVTGYGSTTSAFASLTWYGVNKTHAGPFVGLNGFQLQYTPDTTGGNSGSPVILDSTGEAIGIHTHGGCTSTGGSNSGTFLGRPEVQAAIAATCPDPNALRVVLTGQPSFGLNIAIENIPANSVEGYTIFSLNTALPVGQGVFLGLMPDTLTIAGFGLPAQSGSLFHFVVPSLPTHYPSVPFNFPAGTFAAFAGISVDAVALLIQNPFTFEVSDVVRHTF